ncbi:AGAP006339-PA-like protein [Anopheles sinensis]|uniref:AGAP006339-PA-like protein n=1 Tax=Anopheles sinensis TaxID=74873 RepID=A0A084WKB1_ANOSI|nr:AGAP006339-PA-like protein [Anopheles sinensis]
MFMNSYPRANSDSASNYVDRVRIRDSSNSFGGPGRGSGWRQKSLSNIDLPTSYRGITGGGITGGGLGAGQFRYRDYDSGLYDLYSRIDSRREEYEDLYGVNPKAARANGNNALGGGNNGLSSSAGSANGAGGSANSGGASVNGSKSGSKKRHHRSQEVIAYDKSASEHGHSHHHHHHHHHGSSGTQTQQQQQQQQLQQFYNSDSNEACSLRRTRSLAVIREESYNDLHLPGRGGARRSQLIPKAKLIDRNFFKERFSYIYDDNGDVPEAPESEANYTLARRFSSSAQLNGGGGTGAQQQPPFPWHTDKSDLDSIDSSIFKHSLHQQNSFDGSRHNSIRSDSTKFVSKVEVHSQYSGVSGSGGKSDTGVDADLKLLDDLSLKDEPGPGSRKTSTLDTVKKRTGAAGGERQDERRGKYGPREEDESGITIIEIKDSQVSHKSSSVISYDSIYLSSESDEKELLDDPLLGPPPLPEENRRRRNKNADHRDDEAHDLIDIKFDEYDALFHPEDLDHAESTIDTLYGQVTKPKPKIVAVEPKVHQNDSLRRFIKNTGRSTIERLSLISNLKLRQEFGANEPTGQSIRKDKQPLLPASDSDYQYNSLPDADVCKILRNSERIDAKLRRIADNEHAAGGHEGPGDASGRARDFDSLPRLHHKANLNLTRHPSDEETSLEESDKGAPSIEVVETPTKEVLSQASSKVYLKDLGLELDYENSVVTANSDQESDITIVAPQEDLEVPTPAIVVTPAEKHSQETDHREPSSSSSVIYSTFASTVGKHTTNRINFESKERQKPEPNALREVRTKLKPIPVQPETPPKVPLALAPTVKLGGKKVIVDEVAAKAAKREKQELEKQVDFHEHPKKAPPVQTLAGVVEQVLKKPLKPVSVVGTDISKPKKETPEASLAAVSRQVPIPIVNAKQSVVEGDTDELQQQPVEEKQGSPKVDHSSLFKETNPFKEAARREIKNKVNDRPLFKGVRRFNSTENIYTSTPIIVTKTFNNCIKTNEVKTKSFDSLIVEPQTQGEGTNNRSKMPRPQVIQIVDSSKQQLQQQQQALTQTVLNGADTLRKTSKNGQQTQKEFLHKVDSVRSYWSKMLDEVDQLEADGASDSSKTTTSTKAASSTSNGSIITSATTTNGQQQQQNSRHSSVNNASRNKYSTYQIDDDDELHFQSFSPTVEIIELDGHKQAALVKPKNAKDLDFDHVRYKVMKSEMFQKNLLVNHRKAAQFDGLMQYLQDYSFQELLAHNNVVIIEPVRTKIEKISDKPPQMPAGMCKITNGALTAAGKRQQLTGSTASGIKKHFFYHPIRVNKELLDEELPSPDTVRNVRKLFEGTLRLGTAAKQAYEDAKANGTAGIRKWDSASLSSGVSSSGDLSSPCDCDESAASASAEHLYASATVGEGDELESHYVSQDVLEKIRECGSTVTYYGGRVLDKRTEHISTMTRAIMREIRGQDRQCGVCQPHGCAAAVDDDDDEVDEEVDEEYDDEHANGCPSSRRSLVAGERDGGLGVKFKLVKSNSCSSRLELAGTGKTPPDLLRPNGRMRGRHILEENSRCTAEATIEEPEETVRDMVSRLESHATLTTRSKPRIIESKCIEKYEPEPPGITINSQATAVEVVGRKSPATMEPGSGVDDSAGPVTVNNHINFVHHHSSNGATIPQPPPIPGSPAVATSTLVVKSKPVMEQQQPLTPIGTPVSTFSTTSAERPPKVCRNKNVDLAFAATIRQIATLNGNGTVARPPSAVRKSASQVSASGSEGLQDRAQSPPQSASSVTKTVTFNFTAEGDGPVAAVEKGHKPTPQTNGTTVDQSENLRPSAIAEQRKTDELTSPKLVNWSTVGRFDERQYFANDRKLIEKRKYDDMEFEEFEVLDPNAPPSTEHYDSLNSSK